MPDVGVIRTLLAPRKTLFGVGAVDKVADEAKLLGGKKILLVTDETVLKLKIVDKVLGPLKAEGFDVDVWDKVEPEPTVPRLGHFGWRSSACCDPGDLQEWPECGSFCVHWGLVATSSHWWRWHCS